MSLALLWIPATLLAAVAQTTRNAMQSSLTAVLGTVGATQVRFLYGFPFALLFLLLVTQVTRAAVPSATLPFLVFCAGGALAQIAATAMMLAAMKEQSFAVTTAMLKTEPIQVALFGVIILGDHLTLVGAAAILVATLGVVVMALKPGTRLGGAGLGVAGLRPALLGIGAGSCFALAAVGFRGAILALPEGSFLLRATTTLAWALGLQTLILLVWLGAFDRPALLRSFKVWRASLLAGFMGAVASQFWFIGFSLTSAANVRTLALVEVFFAQAVSRKLFAQSLSRRDFLGMALIMAGVILLLWSTR